MSRYLITLYAFILITPLLTAGEISLADPTRPEFFNAETGKLTSQKSTNGAGKKKAKPLILRQTIVSENRRLAIINGFVLTEGERLKGGFLVLRINDDHVILTRGSTELILYLAGKKDIKEVSR